MRRLKALEIGFVAVLLVVSAVTLWAAQGLPGSAQRFPTVIGAAMVILLAAQLVASLRSGRRQQRIMDVNIGAGVPGREALRRGLGFLAWIGGLLLSLLLFGHVGLVVATFLYMRVGYRERWLPSIAVTAVIGGVIYVASEVLRLRLYEGLLL